MSERDSDKGGRTQVVCDFEGCLKAAEEATDEGYFCKFHLRKFRGQDTDNRRREGPR